MPDHESVSDSGVATGWRREPSLEFREVIRGRKCGAHFSNYTNKFILKQSYTANMQ
jgi:hypothetical protein